MEADFDPRPTGDCRSLASDRLQNVLEVAFSTPDPSGKKVREQGIARTHLPNGPREPDLGRATDCRQSSLLNSRYNFGTFKGERKSGFSSLSGTR